MPALKTSFWMLLFALVADGDSSRILGLFPHPGLSHYKFFKPIMNGLADAGHEVVVVSYFPDTKAASKNYVDLALTKTDEILTEMVDLEVSIRSKVSKSIFNLVIFSDIDLRGVFNLRLLYFFFRAS
jgi:hypothetical protein